MPRPALTTEQRREIRRKIRRAAAELYAEDGLKKMSVRAVAEGAGVSVGTIYSYFANLTELMQSLWKEPVFGLLADLERVAAETKDPRERLRALMDAYIAFSRQQSAVYRGAFLFVRPSSHEKPSPVSLQEDRLFGFFRQAVIDGQQAGVFRSGDPSTLTQALWSGVHGAIALPINVDRLALDSSGQVTELVLEALLNWLETSP